MKIVNITGVGNSGKGAAVDLLRGYSEIWAPKSNFEFDFFRVNGGMIDFLEVLKNDKSQMRIDLAFKKVRKNTLKMGLNPSILNIYGNLISTSQRYDKAFNNNFLKLTYEFLDELILYKTKAFWPYDRLETSIVENFLSKISLRLGFENFSFSDVYYLNNKDLHRKFDDYLNKLISNLDKKKYKVYLLNNFFEPCHIKRFENWISDLKSIVVVRDPRDIFLSGLSGKQIKNVKSNILPSENDGIEKSFLGTNNIDFFIERFKSNISSINLNDSENQIVIKFEDLIFNLDKTKEKIFDFLDDDLGNFIETSNQFDPKKSQNNTFLWEKENSYSNEIKVIENKLSQYLYH